ncbi:isochorismatase [Bacillus sp. TS-2]|nr:isochorismatase [Bacillus sp. TS-2]
MAIISIHANIRKKSSHFVLKELEIIVTNSVQAHKTALIIIDMINDLHFEHGERLLKHALPVAKNIAELKKVAYRNHLPVIYVNDNYGRWQSDFRHLVEHCLHKDVLGKPLAELLKPGVHDYFVLKPQFSGFFGTPLNILLEHLGIDTLIITGVAGNMCVQFTANDAYMNHYRIFIPSDCVASNSQEENHEALKTMENVIKATITPSTDKSFPFS